MDMSDFNKWVSVFGNAVSITENRPEQYSKNITLRYPVGMPFDAKSIRFTFDNYCGTEPVTLTSTTFFENEEIKEITFGGKTSVTIPAGQTVVSDEIVYEVRANSEISVSFYLGDYTQMRSGVYTQGCRSGGMYAIGDYTHTCDIPIECSRNTNINYFLTNVSVLTTSDKEAVVCYGDSITAQDWADELYELCIANGLNKAIIRRATSGSRILREYSCITYESYGLKGTKRFMHEVPTDGSNTLIIQQGINDIIHPVGIEVNPFRPMSDLPTKDELIDGLKWYIDSAKELGFKVYVGTLLPIKGWRTYAPFRDELKDAYNDFIRNTSMIDGVIDFDKAVRNPEDVVAFLPEFDSGDHLHPSREGYKAMAKAAYEVISRG